MKELFELLRLRTFKYFYLSNSKRRNKPFAKLKMYIYYPSYFLFVINCILFLFALVAMVAGSKSESSKYPSSRYRKVVKKGLIWDSVEYHER